MRLEKLMFRKVSKCSLLFEWKVVVLVLHSVYARGRAHKYVVPLVHEYLGVEYYKETLRKRQLCIGYK